MSLKKFLNLPFSTKEFGRVAVLMGGQHSEREISLLSGKAVLQALLESNIDAYGIDVDKHLCKRLVDDPPDRVFIAMHGTFGEDGTLQGLLESLAIPYTGSNVLASAISMNKQKTKLIWQAVGLPTPDFMILNANTSFHDVIERFTLPIVAKPTCEGSSVGITKVENQQSFEQAKKSAQQFACDLMIEPWIEGEEITAGILADTVLPVIGIKTPVGFYDYEAKYFSEDTQFLIPSGLSKPDEARFQELALQAYEILGCRHWGRVDAIMDKNKNIWLLEVNTIPGLTSHSLVPQAAHHLGLDFKDLILVILKQTLHHGF